MKTMTDKNGKEMITGQVVKIENAYFKNDNGFYFINHTPGDVSWCGSDYSLTKILKNGSLSTGSHKIAFWPLAAFTNNREKNAECRKHNAQYATIEIIETIGSEQIMKHFEEELKELEDQIQWQEWNYGEESNVVKTTKAMIEHYKIVIERMKTK